MTKKMDQGHLNEALAALDKTIQELSQYGERGAEAIKILQEMKSKIGNDEWTLRERKSSMYRSASYLKMSSRHMWTHGSPPPSFKQKPPGSGNQPTAT